jgi:hypothetical protein
MSALMVVAEVVDTVCLMRGFAHPDGLSLSRSGWFADQRPAARL